MPPKEDYSLKETKPNIAGTKYSKDRPSLVELQPILFVRVEGAENLLVNPPPGGHYAPYVQLTIGNYTGKTRAMPLHNHVNPRWDRVFCFRNEILQSKTIQISVKDDLSRVEIGTLSIPIGDAPTTLPGDSQLVPQVHCIQKNGNPQGYLRIAFWIGNQTDVAFPGACHADAASVSFDKLENVGAKTYQQPRLWYLRVKLLKARDLVNLDPNKKLEVYVKARLGDKTLKTKPSSGNSRHRSWNEEMIFVAAEPFDDTLVLKLVLKLEDGKEERDLGFLSFPLHKIGKRLVAGAQSDVWEDLKQTLSGGEEVKSPVNFASKILLNMYLDGVYHVFDEPAQFCSDLTAASPKMKPGSIGKFHLGIGKAVGLASMKNKNGVDTADAFCVAKYGFKWIKTSTVVGSLDPTWNEQYQWDVYDPCTVITIGVLDNCNLEAGAERMDLIIGKVRIRISSLESGKVYTLAFPMVGFNEQGMKKMGELHLNFMFYIPNIWSSLATYGLPLLPKAHHTHPLSVAQLKTLRYDAVTLICSKLSRSGPPLRREVVEYMLSAQPRVWSVRRGKATYARLIEFLTWFSTAWTWYDDIREWKSSVRTVTVWLSFVILLFLPWWLILPPPFFYLFGICIWNYRKRPKLPLFLDMKLSQAEGATAEEWQEEFDTFPSSADIKILRVRYDRLRGIGLNIVTIAGDLANQLERVQSVTTWRDPRATFLFTVFCLFAALVTFVVPFKWLLFCSVTYLLRFPKLRVTLPPVPQNFLRRLPSKEDCLL